MSMPSAQLKLKIGGHHPQPANATLMGAVESVQVQRKLDGPSGFQITFRAEKTGGSSAYAILEDETLRPFNRVNISVDLGGSEKVLMDGLITHQEFNPQPANDARLVVTGEDMSLAMDFVEISFQYPMMPDPAIVGVVLAKYMPFSIFPEIIPPPESLFPSLFLRTPQQFDTDRDYLMKLAKQYAYIFHVRPGDPGSNNNFAYWGPPDRFFADQQTALNVDAIAGGNVQKLSFAYDGKVSHFVTGMVLDTDVAESFPLPVIGAFSTRLPLWAKDPALYVLPPRSSLIQAKGMGYLQTWVSAVAEINQSVDKVVTGQGTVDTFRYGSIIEVGGKMPVRGAGSDYDGYYLVEEVDHEIKVGSYHQNFTIAREGLGSTATSV